MTPESKVQKALIFSSQCSDVIGVAISTNSLNLVSF